MARQTVCDVCGKVTNADDGGDWEWTFVVLHSRSGLPREINICTTCLPTESEQLAQAALSVMRRVLARMRGRA